MKLPYTGIRVKRIEVGEGKWLTGIEIDLPGSPPMVILRGGKGFAMCGLLNIEAADKLGLIAVRVPGVSSVEEMLESNVSETTSKALEIGIKPGDKVRDIIDKLT